MSKKRVTQDQRTWEDPRSTFESTLTSETRQIALQKCSNEWAPLGGQVRLDFKAAFQPSLYAYPVYRTQLCKLLKK